MSSETNTETAWAELLPILDRIACAIETLAEQPARKSRKGPRASKQSEAMVWAVTHQVTDNRVIADHFGVDPRTVRRWSQLQQLLDGLRLKVSPGEPNSGYHTTDGVEAYLE
jgi:hypothetical protein